MATVIESLSGVQLDSLEARRPQLQDLERLLQVQITDMVGLRGCTVMVAGTPAAVAKAMPLLEHALLGSSSWEPMPPPGFSPAVGAKATPAFEHSKLGACSWQPTPPPGLRRDLACDVLSICLSEAATVADDDDDDEATRENTSELTSSSTECYESQRQESSPAVSSLLLQSLNSLATSRSPSKVADIYEDRAPLDGSTFDRQVSSTSNRSEGRRETCPVVQQARFLSVPPASSVSPLLLQTLKSVANSRQSSSHNISSMVDSVPAWDTALAEQVVADVALGSAPYMAPNLAYCFPSRAPSGPDLMDSSLDSMSGSRPQPMCLDLPCEVMADEPGVSLGGAPCTGSAPTSNVLADALKNLASQGLGREAADDGKRKKARKRKNGKAAVARGTESPEEVAETVSFVFPKPACIEGVKSRKKAIMLVDQVSFKHENAKMATLTDLTFSFSQTSRILVTGANKSGKSTLVQLLLGFHVPTHGSISRAVGLQLGGFSQESIRALEQHLHETPAHYISSEASSLGCSHMEDSIEEHLSLFGLSLSDARNTLIGQLTVNAKALLALALMFWQKPQIVFFDEPSVCVSSEVLPMLTQAIHNFKGGVVIFEHSRKKESFEGVATEKWNIRGGKVHIEGGPAQLPAALTKAGAASAIGELEHRLREVMNCKPPNEREMQDIFQRLEQLKASLKR